MVIPPLGEGSDNIVFYPDELPVGTLNVALWMFFEESWLRFCVARMCGKSVVCGDWPVRLICALLT